MTDEQKELVKQFFEMKAKQMILQIWLAIHRKPGYVGIEGAGEMMEVMKKEDKLHSVEEDLMKFLVSNESFFRSSECDLNRLQHEQEFKVSFDKQKEIAKEVLGYEITIEDLLSQLPPR